MKKTMANVLEEIRDIPGSAFPMMMACIGKNEREIPENAIDELTMLYALMLSGASPMYLDMRDAILHRLKALNHEVMDVNANIRCDVTVCKKHEWYCLVWSDKVEDRTRQFQDFCKWLMNDKRKGE